MKDVSLYTVSNILFTLHTIINMTSNKFLMKYISTIGEPILQIITNWVTTKGTTLGQREPKETNLPGLKSK